MKTRFFSICCFLFFIAHLSAQQKQVVQYDASNHTLSISASRVPISTIVDQLAAQNFQLFIIKLEEDFPVSASFRSAPVDEALTKIVPSKFQFFYRVEGSKTVDLQTSAKARTANPASLQKAAKPETAENSGPTQATAASTVQLGRQQFRTNPPSLAKDELSTSKELTLPGKGEMADARTIREGKPQQAEDPQQMEIAAIKSPKGKHLVVTFRITKNSMEPVAAAFESGEFVPQNAQTAIGNFAIVGSSNQEIAYLEAFENPLEARAIFDPEHKSDHGSFQLDEGFVSVRMPETFADANQTRNLKFELAQIDANPEVLFEKASQKKLNRSELLRSVKMVQAGRNLNLSRVRILDTTKAGNR